jgi:ESS family glutamate:Na+ symporter
MSLVWPVVFASMLLLCGFAMRATMRPLQRLFLPASVLGGLVGLVLIQAWLRVSAIEPAGSRLAGQLSSWPGLLIAVVFAGLLLEKPSRSDGSALSGRSVIQAGLMVWVIVLGEIAIGLLAAAIVITPVFGLPPIAGQLIEAGFAGGHGTAAALGQVYAKMLGFEDGRDLGFFMATAGLIWSVVSGIALVNIGIRMGWTRREAVLTPSTGLEARVAPTPMAFARVSGDVLDPFVFQISLVAGAIAIGAGFQAMFSEPVAGAVVSAFGADGEASSRLVGYASFVHGLPLFLFTLIGGWALRHAMARAGIDDLIDSSSIKRIVAIAMEFLIVAAIASLRVEVIRTNLWPLLILCALGFVWAAACLVVISPRILPREYWFELGLINYGMSTGTTAQGMMLLRTIDRDLESGAAEDYALAAPLSAPFIGGGILTLALPALVVRFGALGVGLAACVVVIVLIGVGFALRARAGPSSSQSD